MNLRKWWGGQKNASQPRIKASNMDEISENSNGTCSKSKRHRAGVTQANKKKS